MSPGAILRLGLRFALGNPGRSATLVLALALVLLLPLLTVLGGFRLERALQARAEQSPLLVAAPGDPYALLLSTLWFRGDAPEELVFGDRKLIGAYGEAIPLRTGFTAGNRPLVGTGPEYYDARGLILADGRKPAVIGEVLAGAALDLRLGDRVQPDPADPYDLGAANPLELEVVGILAPSGQPDDRALFTTLETTWALDGALHGHPPETTEGVPAPPWKTAASVDEQSIASFHLHGDRDQMPVTAFLVLPRDDRARDQLLGDLALETRAEGVLPMEVVGRVLELLDGLRRGLLLWTGLIGLSTLLFGGVVLRLVLHLRERELSLLHALGASRRTLVGLVLAEIAILLLVAAMLAGLLSLTGLLLLERLLG